ncbi:hypothetical protein MED01_002420 [Micromonospora sp. MED01]|uniref:hypothetical protein n=1 Tax=Micromonospora alfalfae TaxID=2911212 RepID=UPI001EE91435|nr:hypothetical protein [Micromonospora alfalfae]MCG5464255.1 hypothetical protein [Micromonospora alfalfae]
MYGIPTLPVDEDGYVVPGAAPIVGYIGKSVQTVYQRQEQHRDDQPFSDLIVGGSWVIEEGFWTDAELSAREEWWIRNGAVLVRGGKPQRPVYNYEFNLDNPNRVEVWRAVEQRQAREPGWVKPANGSFVPRQRTYGPPQNVARVVRRRPRIRWTRRRIRAAMLAAVWLVMFAGFWWAGWDVWHGWDGPRNAAIGAAIVMGVASVGNQWVRPKRRRRRSRR